MSNFPNRKLMQIQLSGELFSLEKPRVMGILNVTPDSFYDGGKYTQEKYILQRAEQILTEGAFLIDIGGYSSRPQADDITEDLEKKRVIGAIELIKKYFPEAHISIDTFRSGVAKEAVEAGAEVINDISGGNLDKKMFQTVADLQVPYILMHMRGTPQTMKKLTTYENIFQEILFYFIEKVQDLHKLGVADIIIDLGFGFAKNISQNFQLLKYLKNFKILELPILVGLSRKSMIYKTLNLPNAAQDALNGTSVLNTFALLQGSNLLRVHEVKEALEAIKLLEEINQAPEML